MNQISISIVFFFYLNFNIADSLNSAHKILQPVTYWKNRGCGSADVPGPWGVTLSTPGGHGHALPKPFSLPLTHHPLIEIWSSTELEVRAPSSFLPSAHVTANHPSIGMRARTMPLRIVAAVGEMVKNSTHGWLAREQASAKFASCENDAVLQCLLKFVQFW